jgi:phosphoglycerol transferase MdoB-like AlkP superfamily enzyme
MIPAYARFLLKTYFLLIALFTAARLLAGSLHTSQLSGAEFPDLAYAFVLGWRFDNAVVCTLIAIPFVLGTINHFTVRVPFIGRLLAVFLLPLVMVCLVLLSIDLFYFEHFGLRITVVLLNWLSDLSFAVSMAIGDPRWWWGIAGFPFLAALVIAPLWVWSRTEKNSSSSRKEFYVWGFTSFLLAGLLFLGIRGRVAIKSPLREGLAYFSPNPALNQLALNPVFTFFSSWVRARKYKEKSLRFMDHQEAMAVIHREPGRVGTEGHLWGAPLQKTASKNWNVVVVMMEGMSAHYTHYRKNPSWTPVLDRLMSEGWEFTQAYSAGTHTYNGVWSTLFSFPSPYASHPLKRDIIPLLDAWPDQWRRAGRRTFFFTTHDEEFDNMAGFLRQNGFETIVAQSDYPSERVFSILGVPDHDMYDKAIATFDSVQGPFFAALLTGSNHKPHVIPPELKAQFDGPDEKENIVRYSDWAVGHFLTESAKRPWFKNTLFVFLADHGQAVGSTPLDQVMSYHHMPLIFWGPNLLGEHRLITTPVGQTDVLPTLAGIISGVGRNNSLGRDVLAHPRPWVYMVRDDSACVRFSNALECESPEGVRTRFELPQADWQTGPLESKEVWREVHAHLQLADWVLRTPKPTP